MQDFKQITRNFSISGQISPEDLPRLRERGVKVIINNRPDGEEAGQISSDSLAEAAAGLGLAFYALPMRPGELDPTIMERPSAIRAQADGPVHAFCRTGNRSLKM